MKRKFIYLLSTLFIGGFIACNNDGDDPITPTPPTPDPVPTEDIAYQAEGLYSVVTTYMIPDSTQGTIEADDFRVNKAGEGLVRIETPFIEVGSETAGRLGLIVIDSIPVVKEEEDYVFSVSGSDKVNTSNFENPIVTIEGRISNGTLQASLRLSNETRQIDFQFLGNQIAFDEANILDIQIEHDAIVGGPEINGREIVFYVHPQTDMSSLELAPVLTLSKGASSMPASGATIDFAQYKDYTVEYTVIAENLSTNIYSVVIKQGGDLSLSSFENWVSESSSYSDLLRPTPNWATSNLGIESIRSLGILMGVNYTGGPVVLQEENGYQGHSAKVVTANTIGGASLIPGVFPSIPVITSGSLFTGDFVVDAMNTLNSTQFGIPYFQKPTNVKGYFKYTPGENYYYCKDPSVSNEAEIDNTKTDECSLCAVLYEVENYDDFLNGETIYTSDKIVAIAQQFAGNTPDYTAFDLQLEYKKEYDPTKKYRFAIIFSSSKDGAAFSGAEGSTLWIDEVEVINE